jgi:hypothetical protein
VAAVLAPETIKVLLQVNLIQAEALAAAMPDPVLTVVQVP